MAPAVSVVVPVFRSETTLAALHRRLTDVLPADHEVVFVDDASPDGSAAVLARIATGDPRVRIVEHPVNRGQHAAVLSGLGAARGDAAVVLDADEQDPPEAIPALLARLRAPDRPDAVFALRRGVYEPFGRRVTARAFRAVLRLVSRGRLPAGAGMYVALSGDLVGRLAASAADGPAPYVVGLIGRNAVRAVGIPVERAPATATAYTSAMRATVAARALREAARR
jgi:polyisoprenyl-phosphate glycosyltransferase